MLLLVDGSENVNCVLHIRFLVQGSENVQFFLDRSFPVYDSEIFPSLQASFLVYLRERPGIPRPPLPRERLRERP